MYFFENKSLGFNGHRIAEESGKRASVSHVSLQRNVGHSRPWFFRKLCTMPDRNDPDHIAFNSVKEPVWRYDYLLIGKVWKLRYDSSGFRKVLEPSQDSFSSIKETDWRCGFISSNEGQCRQKLGPGRRSKADFHDGSTVRIESASARTASRS